MKLLRKFRRSLIFSGKFKSYIIYALGEIVLIVIGVTIAWKINDLNDIRKSAILTQKIEVNLNEELSANLRLLKRKIDIDSEMVAYLENTLKYVGKNETELSQGAKDTITNIAHVEVQLLESTMNSVLTTSKLEQISNVKLKDLLSLYYHKIENFKNQEGVIKAIISEKLKPILEEYVSLSEILPDNEKYKYIKQYGSPSNYSGLLHSKKYQNSVIDRLLETQKQLENSKILLSKTKTIIAALEAEIK
ncbi:hypothetical protein PW52_13480 [Tamlana sedimentorum]|uniref:Uncharacterized protein n=1 Tax=Neotamlana sedimentorum TaxID=1435349 RepID=A0A0D7W8Q6_9FLAO|nr:hypothetical protein [Tamlana sedimentorum]KJD34202.1 hypothetical protein PW52_13480 [Tamlana sedimentorum]